MNKLKEKQKKGNKPFEDPEISSIFKCPTRGGHLLDSREAVARQVAGNWFTLVSQSR